MDRNESRLPAKTIGCPVATLDGGHGQVGKVGGSDTPFNPFTQILDARTGSYDLIKLGALAQGMVTRPDKLSDGPDAEENLYVPAGYTYFGQFIDHDLTLDTTSTLNPEDLKDPQKPLNDPTNLRSPRFDLDCVYGNGPGDQPYMYAADDATPGLFAGASLLIDAHDLARAGNGRAIIGDKRNDENSIVNQIQQIFIRFHNQVVRDIAKDTTLRGGALFQAARDQVRWAYQRIILEDFLPRIIDPSVLDAFAQNPVYELYPAGPLRWNLPREFVAAAYRYGHSGVRTGYRLNGTEGPSNGTILPIFNYDPDAPTESLIGFDPLPPSHVIDDWGRFFPTDTPRAGERTMSNVGDSEDVAKDGSGGNGAVRLQYAYKLDPSIVDPLANLPPKVAEKTDILPASERSFPSGPGPSLAFLNLLRGNRYQLQGGQAYARKLGVAPLDRKYLCVRVVNGPDGGPRTFTFVPISELRGRDEAVIGAAFADDTPLWFYVLAEAQMPIVDFWLEHVGADGKPVDLTEDQMLGRGSDGTDFLPLPEGTDPKTIPAIVAQQLRDSRCAGTRLGAVGGRIVTEVFHGLMESDSESVLNRQPGGAWQPIWNGPATMANLLRYVDPDRAP